MSTPYRIEDDVTGLGRWYRLRWKAGYTMLSILGPANRQPEIDPRAQMRRERAARLLESYAAAGQEPPADLHVLARHGYIARQR